MIDILLFIFIFIVYWYLKERNTKKKLPIPPGPIRWPIIGSIPQMPMENFSHGHLQLSGLAKKYGPIFSIGYGVHYAVVVSSFDILKEVLSFRQETIDRFRFDFTKERANHKNLGLIWANGDVWRDQRKLTLRLMRQFGFGKKMTMVETINAEVVDLAADIEKKIIASGGIWEVDLNRLSACSVNIIWAFIIGSRFDPQSPKIQSQLEISHEIFESLSAKSLLPAFPFLKYFPELSGYNKQNKIHKMSREFTKELIEDAKLIRRHRIEPETFLEAYLDEIEKNKSNPASYTTEEQLTLLLMDLFLAGADTTSGCMNWIILYLALNQNVQNKAREEINKCAKTVELASISYVHAMIREVMRHAPFYNLGTPRRIAENIECAGYRIPAGTLFFANYYSMFHDKKVWGDPEVFRPERLLHPDGTLNRTLLDGIPEFGIGARTCPGENVAMASVFHITVGLLRRFSFDVIVGKEPSLEPGTPSLVAKPKKCVLKVKQL